MLRVNFFFQSLIGKSCLIFLPEYDQRYREPINEQHRGVRGEGAGDVRGEARPPHGRPRSPAGLRACGYLRHPADHGVHVQGTMFVPWISVACKALPVHFLLLSWLSAFRAEWLE